VKRYLPAAQLEPGMLYEEHGVRHPRRTLRVTEIRRTAVPTIIRVISQDEKGGEVRQELYAGNVVVLAGRPAEPEHV
jgi:hypothetical protein